MSVTRNLILTAAATVVAVGVGSAYAGGQEPMCAPAAAPAAQPYFYGELGVGYAQTNYSHFFDWPSDTTKSNFTNENAGLGYAGDVGYSFMPHMAVELGGGSLPQAKFDDTTYLTTSIGSWYGYGAVRFDHTMPKVEKMDLYLKGGIAYRSFDVKFHANDYNDSYWAPMMGAGVAYHVSDNFYVAGEANHIAGTSDSDRRDTWPAAAMYMLKLGYQFNS